MGHWGPLPRACPHYHRGEGLPPSRGFSPYTRGAGGGPLHPPDLPTTGGLNGEYNPQRHMALFHGTFPIFKDLNHGELGLLLNGLGAIMIILPQLPFIGKPTLKLLSQLPIIGRGLHTGRISGLQRAKRTIFDSSVREYSNGDPGFSEIYRLFNQNMGICPSKIKVSGVLPHLIVVHYEQEDGTPIQRHIEEPTAIGIWITDEIERVRRKHEIRFLSLGAFLLFCGFSLRFLSKTNAI